jgi:predicted Zn-dependent protease
MLLGTSVGAGESPSPLLSAMEQEVNRARPAFAARTPGMYYLACGVTETESVNVGAEFGALTVDQYDRRRELDTDARCGSYERDNTHPLPGQSWDYGWSSRGIPLEDAALPIRMALWRDFESSYRRSAERFSQVQALDITKAALRDKSDDFSREKSETFVGPLHNVKVDRAVWREKVKRYTLPLRGHPDIYAASAFLRAVATTRFFVNSEGARLQFSRVGYYLSVSLVSRSTDGMDLPVYESFFAWEPEGLPSDDRVLQCVSNLTETVEKLRLAPIVEPYSGPAVLQGEAAAVFMHEVLGHRLEGHRQKDEKQSQTFRGMVGKPIMPSFLSILFDPTIAVYKGQPMAGLYPYDEQGVKAQRVTAIEKGVLREFLMSRMPIEGFPKSNGHGRAQPGLAAVSRQSNMIIESSEARPAVKIRDMLKEECVRQGKPYGLLFAKVEGGFTMTGRVIPNAYNVRPLVVYRVYTDDRPDELVRGVDIIGTPLAALTKVMAAGDDVNLFNGFCGAESGGIPVGAVSPTLLLRELEVQKKEVSRASAPVLPPPGVPAPSTKEVQHE